MEQGFANMSLNEPHKKNRIQVSNMKKPLFFYVNLAKRYMQQNDEVELSALGMAIATVVTVAKILENNGLAVEKRISTSTFEDFDHLMEAAAEEREVAPHDIDLS